MATRLQLETQAMTFIQRGSYERASQAFHEILKQDPKDRRIRQRLGELYLKMNRPADALRFLADAAEQSTREGQHRAAVAVYKMVLQIQPNDPEYIGLLGECYRKAGLAPEADRLYEQAVALFTTKRDFDTAVDYARRLLDIRPKDTSLRFKIAELLQSAGQRDEAIKAYREIHQFMAKRGDHAEVARITETLLELQPDSEEYRLQAAEARLAQGDGERATTLIQPLRDRRPNDPRILEIVAGTHLRAGRLAEARSTFLLLADMYKFAGTGEPRVLALKRALEAGEDDPTIRAALNEADRELARSRMKLSELPVFSASVDEEVAICARVDILMSYGFPARAETSLREAMTSRPRVPSFIARMAEVLITLNRIDEAHETLQEAFTWMRGQAQQAVADRLVQIGGARLVMAPESPSPDLDPDDDALATMELIDDELIDDELVDESPQTAPSKTAAPSLSAEQLSIAVSRTASTSRPAPPAPALPPGAQESTLERGRRLMAQGDLDAAASTFQAAYRENPSNEEILLCIADIRRRQRELRLSPAPADESSSTVNRTMTPVASPEQSAQPSRSKAGGALEEDEFARLLSEDDELSLVEPDAIEEVADPFSAGSVGEESDSLDILEEARALEQVGAYDEAISRLELLSGLDARIIEARCLRGLGRETQAVQTLQSAIEAMQGNDPAYPAALFDLGSLMTRTSKHLEAVAIFEEIKDLFPSYRSSEVDSRLRGLRLLLGRK